MNLFKAILFFSFFFSCQSQTELKDNYQVIPHNQLLERISKGEVELTKLSYKNQSGNELSIAERKLLNTGKVYREFFQNLDGEIVEIRIRPIQDDLIFKEIQIREFLSYPFSQIELIEVNCSERDSLLISSFEQDQEVRRGDLDSIIVVDTKNQINVISLIEQCGWPSDPKLIEAIWFVIQHADTGFMAYYYDTFKSLEANGQLKSRIMVKMEDRMLMNHGFPQIYGTQIVGHNVYKMIDPENVNKRRASVGLNTIEEYTRKFGFEYILEHQN